MLEREEGAEAACEGYALTAECFAEGEDCRVLATCSRDGLWVSLRGRHIDLNPTSVMRESNVRSLCQCQVESQRKWKSWSNFFNLQNRGQTRPLPSLSLLTIVTTITVTKTSPSLPPRTARHCYIQPEFNTEPFYKLWQSAEAHSDASDPWRIAAEP